MMQIKATLVSGALPLPLKLRDANRDALERMRMPRVSGTAAEMRARARHLRDLAEHYLGNPIEARLIELADELDAKATDQERPIKPDVADPSNHP